MKTREMFTAGLGAVLLLSFSVLAQQPESQQKPGQMTSMDAMMKPCRAHCSTASRQMDDLMKKMNDARASNDAAKMRAALTDGQKRCPESTRNL